MRHIKFYIGIYLAAALLIACGSSSNNADSLVKKSDSLGQRSLPVLATDSDSIEIKNLISDFQFDRADTFPSIGDVDGDGSKDSAMIMPYHLYYHNHQADSQFTIIHFGKNIPDLKHYNGFRGMVVALEDLDGNKTSEVLYYPEWYQSNWAGIFIYGLVNGKWQKFGDGTINREILDDSKDALQFLKSRVKKIKNNSFEVINHKWNDDSIMDTTIIYHLN